VSKAIFGGTTKECLHHYAENSLPPKGARNSTQAKEPMVNFVGVTTDTITSWIYDRNMPAGGSLVKLRFFLEAVGYDVIELRSLRGQVNYMLAEMLAYGVLSIEQAVEQLGFQNSHPIFRIVHGESNTNLGRAAKIREMYESHKSVRIAAKDRLLTQLRNSDVRNSHEAPILSSTQVSRSPRENEEAIGDESITALAHFVLAITPLLEKAVTEITREQRNKLRKLTGDDGMFRLSKASSRLCSEKAREVIKGNT
jgi:hypothetical protein